MCSSSGSDQYGPMSWTPIGRPPVDLPSGITSAGWPLALNGSTYGQLRPYDIDVVGYFHDYDQARASVDDWKGPFDENQRRAEKAEAEARETVQVSPEEEDYCRKLFLRAKEGEFSPKLGSMPVGIFLDACRQDLIETKSPFATGAAPSAQPQKPPKSCLSNVGPIVRSIRVAGYARRSRASEPNGVMEPRPLQPARQTPLSSTAHPRRLPFDRPQTTCAECFLSKRSNTIPAPSVQTRNSVCASTKPTVLATESPYK